MPPIRQLLRRHGRWLLALVSLSAGLLMVEVIMRMTRLAPPVHAIWLDDSDSFYRRSTNAVLNYELKPGFSRDTHNGRATVNSHGFRDLERVVAKPPGVRRILILGDSVVEGVSYVEDEGTLSRRLESLYPDGRTEVLNLGVSGYCTLAEVTLLAERGLAYSPDLVLLVFVANDFNNFNPEHTVGGGVTRRPEWSKHLFVASDLFRYSALKFNWFQFAEETNPAQRNARAIGDNNVVEGLRLLRELANAYGFQVLVVPWPRFTDTQIGYPNPSGSSPLLIERLALMNGLPVATILDAFPDASNPRLAYTSRGDEMHPNRVAADAVARKLRQLLEAPLKAPPYPPGVEDAEAVEIAKWAASADSPAEGMEARAYYALMRQARNDDALNHLRSLVRQNPRHPWANLWLGRHLYRDREYEAAKPHLLRALELNPSNVEARHLLAYSFSTLGAHDDAIKVVQRGLRLLPNEPNLHLALGAVSLTNAQFELAGKHLEIARRLAPHQPALIPLIKQLEDAQE